MKDAKPTQDQAAQAMYAFAAEQMNGGATADQIEDLLVEKKGLDRDSAASVVDDLLEMRSEALRRAGNQRMLRGAVVCILGIGVTVATYSLAANGGTYMVAWGAMIFGAVDFIRGLVQAATADDPK